MSDIDERVVEMRFNNAQFESGVKTTQGSLAKLKQSLNLDGAARSLNNLQSAGDHFSLSGLANGVEGIGSKISALGVIGVTALATIANQAIYTGEKLVSSLTIDPIKQGLDEYNTNLGAIQTVLANTASAGTTLKDVNAALNDLNHYSDKTIYNFSEMAKNIGTFTAAGVDLKTSTQSIKGIANLAALSGSNSQQASTAMYQLSQAISAGKVGLQDWNSVVNAGMGGSVFQRALATTAVKMGTIQDSAVKLSGKMKNVTISGQSFRNSLSDPKTKGWLTSKVLTQTLSHFTGDLHDSQLAAEGFSKAEIKAIQNQARAAQQAATVVKTLPQLMSTLQESVGSGWTQTWQYIFGDFNQAKKLFTGVYNTLSPLVQDSANARNKMLADWQKFGGRDAAIKGISNAFQAFLNILQPIQKAFRDIFPATTGKQLADISKRFLAFSNIIENFTAQYGPQIYRTFKGLFAVLDIGKQIVVGLIRTIAGLFGGFGDGTGNVLNVTAAIGDFLVRLDEAVKNGTGLTTFFHGLGVVLSVPIKFIGLLVAALADLAAGLEIAAPNFERVTKRVRPLAAMAQLLGAVWSKFAQTFSHIWTAFLPIATAIGDFFGDLGTKIANAVQTGDFNTVLDTINTGLLGGITVLIAKFFKSGFKIDVSGGIFGSIKNTIDGISSTLSGLTDTLSAMQDKLKAQTLLTIAGAVAILTVAVIALSLIDSAALAKSLIAISIMFTELGAALFVFQKLADGPGFAKMPILAAGLILLGIAIDVLAIAVKKMSGIDLPGLAKGLGGVVVLLGALAGTANLMKGTSLKLLPLGAAMIAIAIAINILARAVGKFAALDIAALGRGLGAVAVSLATIAGFSKIMDPKGMITAGAAMILLGLGLQQVAKAVTSFGALDLVTMGKGLLGVAGALLIIAGTMRLMPGAQMIVSAAGLLLVGEALQLIATAMQIFGSFSGDEIGKSLGLLAASLIILAASLILMTEALPGAAALIVAAGALAILAPALKALGDLSMDEIGKSLGVLAAGLAIIAVSLILMTEALPGAAALLVAAAALTVLVPVLTALGSMSWGEIAQGLGALAGVFLVIGVAGALLTPVIPTLLGLGIAIALLGVGLGAAGAGVFLFATGLTALGVAGAAGAAGLTVAFSAILGLIPLAMKEIGLGLVALASAIGDGAPAIVSAVVKLVSEFLDAIGVLIPKLITVAVKISSAFVTGLTVLIPKLIALGTKIVIAMANSIANAVPKLVAAGLKMVLGVLNAIANNVGKFVTVGTRIAVNFINGIANNFPKLVNAGLNLVIKVVNGVADGIRTHAADMRAAGLNLAGAIISGMTGGLSDKVGGVVSAAFDMGKKAISAVRNAIDSHSPSKEFIKLGHYVGEGFAIGIHDSTNDQVTKSLSDMADLIQATIESTQSDIDKYTDDIASAKDKIAKDNDAIKKQQAAIDTAKSNRKTGVDIDKDTVKIQSLTAARARDVAAVKKAAAASTASYKKDGDAKRAQARLDLRSAKANLASNAVAIKQAKATLKKDKADKKNGTTVKDAQAKLKKLTDARNADNASLKDSQGNLKNAQTENAAAAAAAALYNGELQAQQDKLDDLSTQNDALTDSIKTQTQAVSDATKTRDDYNKSLTDQYSTLSDIATDTTTTDYFKNLEDQVTKVNEFATKIQDLRSRGLNDTAYQKLLSEGTDALPFIDQLLNQGADGVQQFDSLTDQLSKAASGLGSTASTSLYQAGVDSAQGLLDGLKSQQSALEDQMQEIADSMVVALKNSLGIKSPSKVFKKQGVYSGQGLIEGLEASAKGVQSASSDLGDSALDGLKSSMSSIADAVSNGIDTEPVIKPVLDLSDVTSAASGIANIMGSNSIAATGSYISASNANAGVTSNQAALQAAKEAVATTNGGAGTTYVQNNYSPKALSNAEIYRGTKNQLSTLRKD